MCSLVDEYAEEREKIAEIKAFWRMIQKGKLTIEEAAGELEISSDEFVEIVNELMNI